MNKINEAMTKWQEENKDKITGWIVEWDKKPWTKLITFTYKEGNVDKKAIFEIDNPNGKQINSEGII